MQITVYIRTYMLSLCYTYHESQALCICVCHTHVCTYVCTTYVCIFLSDETVHTSQMVNVPSHLLYIDCAELVQEIRDVTLGPWL